MSQADRHTDLSGEPGIWLATLPSTRRDRRSALAVIALILVVTLITAPIADTRLPRLEGFIPTLASTLFVTNLITAVLLFALFSIVRSHALLVLAGGYLFVALIVIPFALSFPGAFSPDGFGADLQTPAWLYIFWHLGFSLAVCGYVLVAKNNSSGARGSALAGICWTVAIVVGLVGGATWSTRGGIRFFPAQLQDGTNFAAFAHYIVLVNIAATALALALLWPRRRVVLDQWLLVVLCALMSELLLTGLLVSARFSLAWYSGRLFSVITATAVLAVLLAQTTRLYGRLAHSNLELQRERTNKLMNLEAMAASISHELAQPLAAIVANGRAALNFSGQAPPNLDEVREALNEVISDGHRAHKVLDGIRSLFGAANQVQDPVNMNEIILETLRVLRRELKEHGVTAHTELFPELPSVMGHKGQLQEVILNLVNNAMEAMDTVKNRERLLELKTQRDDRNAILVAVQDTGPGIDREKLGAVFDAFVTTKPKGMGLGLAICRMIVQRHGGTLSAQSGEAGGALFQFTLPVGSVSGPAL